MMQRNNQFRQDKDRRGTEDSYHGSRRSQGPKGSHDSHDNNKFIQK